MFQFVSPITQNPLEAKDYKTLTCLTSGEEYHKIDGIWRMIAPERLERYNRFIEEYELIREAEGRTENSADYNQLPFTTAEHPLAAMWAERAVSFQFLVEVALKPLNGSSLNILDLGAGNGWLANKLAQMGHNVAAVDLTINSFDGLGVHPHYPSEFTPIQAEFDRLPLDDNQFDLVVYNAALHYSADYLHTLEEAVRVCTGNGKIIVIDTPIYQNRETGQEMVAEREADFEKRFGTRSNSIESKNFLTPVRITQLAQQLHLEVQLINRYPSWRLASRRLKRQLSRLRPAAEFPLIVLTPKRGNHAS